MRDWIGFFANFFDSNNHRSLKISELIKAGFSLTYKKRLWLISCAKFSVVIDYAASQRFFFPTKFDALNYLEMLNG